MRNILKNLENQLKVNDSMNPFDIIRSISYEKKQLINKENESEYNSFIVNRGLGRFTDCVLYANQMNLYTNLPNYMKFDYLINTIKPKKRFAKWIKANQDVNILAIMEYFEYNQDKACDMLKVLSDDEIKTIKKQLKSEKGGRVKYNE